MLLGLLRILGCNQFMRSFFLSSIPILLCFFKVLKIFHTTPVPTPLKAMLFE